MLVRIYRMHIA